MKLPQPINNIIDGAGLIVALIVDILMNAICFAVLAPDYLTRAAFVAVGVMIVLFVFRSWSKRHFVAWAIFVTVVFFFDYSFSLEATRTQTEEKTHIAASDPEIARIDADTALRESAIINLRSQYAGAMKRETMDQLDEQIKYEQRMIEKNTAERAALVVKSRGESKLTSRAIFEAIPTAASAGRWLELIIFALIFIGLQLIIATSVDIKAVPVPEAALASEPQPRVEIVIRITPDDVRRFVALSWYRIDNGTSTHVLPKETFLEQMKKHNAPYDPIVYDEIMSRAVRLGIISSEGVINVKSKEIAITKIEETI